MKIRFNKHIYITIAVILMIAAIIATVSIIKSRKNISANDNSDGSPYDTNENMPTDPESGNEPQKGDEVELSDPDKGSGLDVPDVLPEAQTRDLTQFADKKLIMLTFDDGPNGELTRRLVDELAARNARASFFMVGSRLSRFEDTVKYVYESGNTVGIHGYSHKRFSEMYLYDVMDEVDKTNRFICSVTGKIPFYLRPPYGVSTEEIRNNLDMAFILWNLDSEDWRSRNAEAVCDKIVEEAKDGSIVLLHDLYETSVDGALAAIDILSNEGYCFVSIDEYLEIKGVTLDSHGEYRFFNDSVQE